ncbi:MAG: 2-oxo acid dehydrogenase subunit E2 [Halobacteriales archaeon]
MAYEFKLPDVGEGIEEAEVLKWMVDVGDAVLEDDPLAEVETDKAIIEVPSPVDGEVRRLHADVGEKVAVGDILVTFERGDGGEKARNDGGVEILDRDGNAAVDVDVDDGDEERIENDGVEEDVSEATRRLAREIGVDIEDLEGSGEDGRIVAQDVLHAAKENQERRDEERGEDEAGSDDGPAEDGSGTAIPGKGGKTPAMEDDKETPEFGQEEVPAVEPETAEETSMFGDETPVTERTEEDGAGTETTGTEAKKDGTEGTSEEGTTSASEESTEKEMAEENVTDTEDRDSEANEQTERSVERYEGEPGSLMTHHDIADAERLTEVHNAMDECMDGRLTYTPLLVKACSEAVRDHPVFDRREGVNVGVAVETDDGVVVPVVNDADNKGVSEIAEDITDGVAEAVEREDSTEDGDGTDGAVLTVVNVGAVGGDGVSPVVDKPGVAAVSVGEVRRRPFVVDDEVVARYTAPLHLTFDGSAMNSAEAARLTNELKRYLNEPAVMLL